MKKNIGLLLAYLLFANVVLFAQPPQPGKPLNEDEKVKQVTEKIDKELTLSNMQKEKVAAAYKDFFEKMDKQRKKEGNQLLPPPPPPPVSKDVADKLSVERDAKIKAVLNAEQYKQYIILEKSMRPPMPKGNPDEFQPPPNTKKQ